MTVSLAGGTRIRIYLSMILMTTNGINSWFDLITSRHAFPLPKLSSRKWIEEGLLDGVLLKGSVGVCEVHSPLQRIDVVA